MDVFSSHLGKIQCSKIRYFSMKFSSEGEFWHCHFAGNKKEYSNQMFQAKLGSENKKISKVWHSSTVFHLNSWNLLLISHQGRNRTAQIINISFMWNFFNKIPYNQQILTFALLVSKSCFHLCSLEVKLSIVKLRLYLNIRDILISTQVKRFLKAI